MRSLRVMNILTQLLHRFLTVPPPPARALYKPCCTRYHTDGSRLFLVIN